MRRILLLITLLESGTTLSAQEFEVPTGFAFKTEEDFKKYEPDIVRSINWVLTTSPDANLEKRQDAAVFIMKWLDNNPRISIEINPKIVTFMEISQDMLLIFLCGWTKHTLETGNSDNVNGNIKGIEAVVDYYLKNKGKVEKDKHIDKYVKMKQDGQLEQFVKKTVG